VQPAGRWASR
jgi:8-oxo-dGTP diphosphatase